MCGVVCVVGGDAPGGGVEGDEVECHSPVGEPHSCTKACEKGKRWLWHTCPSITAGVLLTLSSRVQAGYLEGSILSKEEPLLQRVLVQPRTKHHPLGYHLAPPTQPPCQALPRLHHTVQRAGVHCLFIDCLPQLLTATSVTNGGRWEAGGDRQEWTQLKGLTLPWRSCWRRQCDRRVGARGGQPCSK